jgi:phage FluMu protein Com
MEVKDNKQIRVEVRCKTCGRLLCYKVSMASGMVEMKCSKCGQTALVNLALRRRSSPIQFRVVTDVTRFLPPIRIPN